nr:hypothetical protein [Candidatus Freyarchaeota archaeon]
MELDAMLYFVVFVLSLSIAVYLVYFYIKNRQRLTILFIGFFLYYSAAHFVVVMSLSGFFEMSSLQIIMYLSLIDSSILLLIAMAMLKVRELYAVAPALALVGIIHASVVDSSTSVIVEYTQFISYSLTKQIIGNPLFIYLRSVMPISFRDIPPIISAYLDPLSVIIPNSAKIVLLIYLVITSVPAAILFYALAWRNKSGKSLGFALGITILDMIGSTGVHVGVIHASFTLVATAFFALGIFGLLDKYLLHRKESQKAAVRGKTGTGEKKK